MNILGISAYYHDSAACLVVDGKIIAAAQEERFTRKKHDENFPVNAINYCLTEARLSAQQIDYVVFYDKPFLKFERLFETYLAFAQEMMRRVYAEEDPTQIHQWASDQIAKLGGAVEDSAVMTWLQSFDFYEELLVKRANDAALPADQRKSIDWLWDSWNRLLDPLEPGMLAVMWL